ncbi:MAG TPA: phosphopyruvate hydratase [SAR202 cluster bacterium]|jgi:enolase|nr:phosphopyruvate hydratase [SAR202 cluster bacterium]HJO60486.1 phosphopyruvate hydratase [SAR202 cluster bacterium]|tara:strand:+ start:1965 stop:3257 length:1293 start_codon:yes stop_codon:yes gene_type:complete
MTSIYSIRAREILDSRGNPTVEVDVVLEDGSVGTSAVPSGASTGQYEAIELRDGDKNRYHGKGVLKALDNVQNVIRPNVIGFDAYDQENLDSKLIELDGTENKSNLGANSILAVSLATAKAAAISSKKELFAHISKSDEYLIPVPMLNVINGGKHAENSTDIQEFMIVPVGFRTFSDAIKAGSEVYQSLQKNLSESNLSTTVGDEGGFAPQLPSNESALEILVDAITSTGYECGRHFLIALDVAAAELFDSESKLYNLVREKKIVSGEQLSEMYSTWVEKYPIISIEDGLSDDEWNDWEKMTRRVGSKVQLVADDLLTTNPIRISKGIESKAANAVLIKPNQIGTLSETLEAISLVQSVGWGTVISHRSGETEDTFISDLAVATNSGQIKSGAPARGERTAKYNRLIRIEESLGNRCRFAGGSVYSRFIS